MHVEKRTYMLRKKLLTNLYIQVKMNMTCIYKFFLKTIAESGLVGFEAT